MGQKFHENNVLFSEMKTVHGNGNEKKSLHITIHYNKILTKIYIILLLLKIS